MEITKKQKLDFCDNYCRYMMLMAEGIKQTPKKARLFHEALNLICNDCPLKEVENDSNKGNDNA